MNETTGKTASCLAIREKRAHRPGGCVGIFFHLFDWNRRFAKKKLFSRKLLTPARARQASKKFGGDEKMPKSKLHLIADENSGGFPNVKKNSNRSCADIEEKHEMRPPSLVARLMGLESMPAVQRDKPKKASLTDNCDVKEDRLVKNSSGFNREGMSLDKGTAKNESRPQKIQKTGSSEIQAVTRFGAEALQIKSVLSRTRKNHHPKLASPLKSPRTSCAKNALRTSRLIDAAARILEPGLQATNRAKCALTYSSSMQHLCKNEVMTKGIKVVSPDLLKQSGYNVTVDKSLKGQTPCKNCGNFVDVVDSRPDAEEKPFVYPSSSSNLAGASSQEQGKNKPKPFTSSLDQERNIFFQRSWDQSASLTPHEEDNTQSSREAATERKPLSRMGQAQWHSASQQGKSPKGEPSTTNLKHMTQAQNQMSFGRDRIPSKAKLSNLQSRRASSGANSVSEAKDFLSLNRNLSGRTRPRVPTKVDNSNFDMERKSCNRIDDSLSPSRTPVRKKRTISVNGQVESNNFFNSTSGKQKSVRVDVDVGKDMGINDRSTDRTCIKSRAPSRVEGSRVSGNKDSNVVSFAFNSPLREKTGICTELNERRKIQNDFSSKAAFHKRELVPDEVDGKKVDALCALLAQKLKELTSQEEDKLTTEGTLPKRSTAMILQELIYALSAEQLVSQDVHMFNTDIAFQVKAKVEETSVGLARSGDHLSPGSVLEASFSNDSCFSSSLDENSGDRLPLESMDCSYDQPQPTEPDTDLDLLDSATSLNKGRTSYEMIIDLVNQISRMLDRINHADLGITGSNLTHANEIILNAELLFGNATLSNSDGMRHFLISPFILDELEILAATAWTNFNCLPGFEETKEGNQLIGFLFDCMIEYLDTKYGRYCNSGFKSWRGLPFRMNAEILIREVVEAVRKWIELARLVPDEIIELEMSQSLGKWTDFDIEAFETGAEIDSDILQVLVEEVVTDLWECRLDSF